MELELLQKNLMHAVKGDYYWETLFSNLYSDQENQRNLHLAILVEPYLEYILKGLKTIESRFSISRCAPYESVKSGDIVLLKRSGGPIVGLCEVNQAWFYRLDPDSWKSISQFTEALCAQDPKFWIERENRKYATLMRIHNIKIFSPIYFKKRDRRGWVVLSPIKGKGDI